MKTLSHHAIQVQPPEHSTTVPILPSREQGKLKFVLCDKCPKREAEHINEPCTHENRSLKGTWFTEELCVALEEGWQITETYSVSENL